MGPGQVELNKILDNHPDVHTVCWGLKKKNGKLTDEECIVCYVQHKLPKSQVSPQRMIPTRAVSKGVQYVTDVQEAPVMSPLWLMVYDPSIEPFYHVLYRTSAGEEHRRCFSPTVPGGAQIAPKGAQWVGTNGAACRRDGIPGALSNWHVLVGGQFGAGAEVMQPHGSASSKPMGILKHFVRIKFRGGVNQVDAAWQDCRDGTGTYVAVPEQIGLGRIKPDPILNPKLGDTVQKSGRTTGVVRNGKVVGVGASSDVFYGEGLGTARFVDQIIVESPGGNFSGPGDSGSLILNSNNQPYGLLFAGGGGQTIANRISEVIDQLGIEFF